MARADEGMILLNEAERQLEVAATSLAAQAKDTTLADALVQAANRQVDNPAHRALMRDAARRLRENATSEKAVAVGNVVAVQTSPDTLEAKGKNTITVDFAGTEMEFPVTPTTAGLVKTFAENKLQLNALLVIVAAAAKPAEPKVTCHHGDAAFKPEETPEPGSPKCANCGLYMRC